MRLPGDTSAVSFIAARPPAPTIDFRREHLPPESGWVLRDPPATTQRLFEVTSLLSFFDLYSTSHGGSD